MVLILFQSAIAKGRQSVIILVGLEFWSCVLDRSRDILGIDGLEYKVQE